MKMLNHIPMIQVIVYMILFFCFGMKVYLYGLGFGGDAAAETGFFWGLILVIIHDSTTRTLP